MPAPKSNTFDAILLLLKETSTDIPEGPMGSLMCFLQLTPSSQRKVMFDLTSSDQKRKTSAMNLIGKRDKTPKAPYKNAAKDFRSLPVTDDFENARTAYAIANALRGKISNTDKDTQTLYDLMSAFNGLCYEKKQAIWEKLQSRETEKEGYIDLLVASGLIYKAEITFP